MNAIATKNLPVLSITEPTVRETGMAKLTKLTGSNEQSSINKALVGRITGAYRDIYGITNGQIKELNIAEVIEVNRSLIEVGGKYNKRVFSFGVAACCCIPLAFWGSMISSKLLVLLPIVLMSVLALVAMLTFDTHCNVINAYKNYQNLKKTKYFQEEAVLEKEIAESLIGTNQ